MSRQAAKRLLKRAFGAVSPWLLPLAARPSLTVLMYHRVLPDGHTETATEQPGMWVSPDNLRAQLMALKDQFRVLHLDEWLSRSAKGQALPDRALAITFDDGWRDNFDYGFPVLQSLGLPATMFLVTRLIGRSYVFWPNRLAELLHRHWSGNGSWVFGPPLDELVRSWTAVQQAQGTLHAVDLAIEQCKRMSDAQVNEMLDVAAPSAGSIATAPSRNLVNLDEVGLMQRSELVRFGSHTQHHTRLRAELDPAVMDAEVRVSRLDLEAILGGPAPLFCYPNGDVSAEALALVRRHYLGAVTTQSGWNGRSSDRHRLQRIGMHNGTGGDWSTVRATIMAPAFGSRGVPASVGPQVDSV